jgi:hypothetical protein
MSTPLLATTLVRADQVRSFLVRLTRPEGWEAAIYDDLRIIQQHLYLDWHHVEQAIADFTLQIATLHEDGWRDAGGPGT